MTSKPTVSVYIRLAPSTHRRLRALAKRRKENMGEVITAAIAALEASALDSPPTQIDHHPEAETESSVSA